MTMDRNDIYDIIIQAGQSNAAGRGRGPVGEEYLPADNILYLVDRRGERSEKIPPLVEIAVAAESEDEGGRIGEFSLSFACRYVRAGYLKDNRKLLIVRAAVGGTGFFSSKWGPSDILCLRMRALADAALAQNTDNRLVAFLWHQGEQDAEDRKELGPAERYGAYRAHLLRLFQSVRESYGGKLPVIAGDFCKEWADKLPECADAIVAAAKDVCGIIGNAAFIETKDLQSNNQAIGNGDDVHFSRDALRILGERYFAAFDKIKGVR